MSITTKDNTQEVLSAMEKAIERGLFAIGIQAEGHAKENETAVDTGLLRNSITFALSGEKPQISSYTADKKKPKEEDLKTGKYDGTAPDDKTTALYLGTNVEYAPYIELGSSGRKPLHFLKRAVTEHKKEYKEIMSDNLKNA